MSNNSTCIQPSKISYMALPIIYTFLCIIGLFGNSLSQWIFLTKIAKKTSTHIYLAHLVTANLLVCSAMPFMGIYFLKGFSVGISISTMQSGQFFGNSIHACKYVCQPLNFKLDCHKPLCYLNEKGFHTRDHFVL